jgi:hypothetical protein
MEQLQYKRAISCDFSGSKGEGKDQLPPDTLKGKTIVPSVDTWRIVISAEKARSNRINIRIIHIIYIVIVFFENSIRQVANNCIKNGQFGNVSIGD